MSRNNTLNWLRGQSRANPSPTVKFPVPTGKYRELRDFAVFRARSATLEGRASAGFEVKFPTLPNREFSDPRRENFAAIRQFGRRSGKTSQSHWVLSIDRGASDHLGAIRSFSAAALGGSSGRHQSNCAISDVNSWRNCLMP